MIFWKDAIKTALADFVERETGTRPVLKPSKKAHLASGSFLRANAPAAAELLTRRAAACTLLDARLPDRIEAENGWLLFYLTADAIDAYARTLPPAEEPDDGFVSRRLWAMARHPDAETPDDPVLLDGFYAMLFAAPNGEERFLSAPRAHDGAERVALEQRLSRMAKILLWERRNMQ